MSVSESENYLARISELESEIENIRRQINEQQITLHEVEKMLQSGRYDDAQRLIETLHF